MTTPKPFGLTVQAAVARIEALDPGAGVFLATRLDNALAEAVERAQEARLPPLAGVPFSIKDEFDTRSLPTTGGSWRHRRRQPTADSDVVACFRDAGAILLGKTNLSDLGVAPEAASYLGGAARNPFDARRTAGGSSGGSAAAVALGCSAFDWGTDIGGSIRMPAAFCGILGLRLSHQTWPIGTGFFPPVPPAMAWMCGQGPLTRTTGQMRAVLSVAAERLRTGSSEPWQPTAVIIQPPDRGRWPSFADDVRPHLEAALDGPVRLAEGLERPSAIYRRYAAVWASHLDDLLASDPGLNLASGLSAVLSSVFLRGLLGDRRIHPATAEILLQVALGRYTIFRNKQAAKARALEVRDAYRQRWQDGQVIATPVCPYPPPRIGRSNYQVNLLSCTVAGNLADSTAISIPFGTFDGRLPRAIQLMGPPGSEEVLLDLTDRFIASRDRDPGLAQPALP